MSLERPTPRHIALVGLYSTRFAVRGGTGIIFLILILFTGLIIAHVIVSPVETIRANLRKEGHEVQTEDLIDSLVDQAKPVVTWAVSPPTDHLSEEEEAQVKAEAGEWAGFLLDKRPALLSAIFMVLVFSMPFLVVTGAFNLYSGDIQSRGLRYQLVRTERSSIFLGRLLGLAIYALAITALLVFTIALYLGLKLRVYAAAELIGWSLQGWLALSILVLPYLALCAWISSAIDTPIASLAIVTSVVGFVPLFAMLGRKAWWPLHGLRYLLPWGYQNDLLHHQLPRVALAVVLCLLYAAAFGYLGLRRFCRRDL
jgi:hypothetical protein